MIYGNPLIFGGSGGGSDTYAFIVVAYPAGSTCTASDGTTTLTAPDTSGSWVCKVPNAGTWTVTSTNGTDSASTTVNITAEGQRESVTLTYGYWIFDNGVIHPDVGSFQGLAGVTLTDGKIVATFNASVDNTFQFSGSVKLRSKGTVMHIKMISTQSGGTDYPTCIGAFNPKLEATDYGTNAAKKKATTQITATSALPETVYDIDLSHLSAGASYWIGGIAFGAFRISQIWVTEA